ncbi:hypothetical protein NDU88_005410 [Pleurodeles waltl]|uniref:Uncharacterized protein n=1 Tax=Pleurodeles waltl TaxID=8319 RepID=A0AAV7TU73_PLEWA|nr:hypothetical protein NDU88_005410 [Pleurodeles waltl]
MLEERLESYCLRSMKAAAASILRQNGKRTSELELPELTAFGHFVCGLKVDEIEKINPQEFRLVRILIVISVLRKSPEALFSGSKWVIVN